MATSIPNNEVEGEGGYDPAGRDDKAGRDFAESGRVEPAADEIAPAEADDSKRLEHERQRRARGAPSMVTDKRKASDT